MSGSGMAGPDAVAILPNEAKLRSKDAGFSKVLALAARKVAQLTPSGERPGRDPTTSNRTRAWIGEMQKQTHFIGARVELKAQKQTHLMQQIRGLYAQDPQKTRLWVRHLGRTVQ